MNELFCDICEVSIPWDYTKMKSWKSVKPAASFAPHHVEYHLCDRCWEFLQDNHAALMIRHGRVANP